MTLENTAFNLVVGTIGSLIAGFIIWFFRRQIKEVLSTLNVSTGAVFICSIVLIMLAVIIVFPIIGIETPSAITTGFMFLLGIIAFHFIDIWRGR